MEQNLKTILTELYAIDPGLKNYEPDLLKIIQKLLTARPDTKFDPQFALKLRAQLLGQTVEPARMAKGIPKFLTFFNNFNFKSMQKIGYTIGVLAILTVFVVPALYLAGLSEYLPSTLVNFVASGKIDDWQYRPGQANEGGSMQTGLQYGAYTGLGASKSMGMAAPQAANTLGYSVGGAKDINNFRENINNNYLPLPTDITYEGLFYDYFFATGQQESCDQLFCPAYSTAITPDPLSGKPEYYLAVGLNSGIKESDFARKNLNLTIVLDISGSMSSPFDRYYYDRFGKQQPISDSNEEDANKSKIALAKQSVVDLTGHLDNRDRFGLVLYNDSSYLAKPLSEIAKTDMSAITEHISEIQANGGTNMSAGMKQGSQLYNELAKIDPNQYENRIIFLTDAMPNLGDTSEVGLLGIIKKNAERGIYTTFIGIGVDFNTELIEALTKIKGANYYSVHSAAEFKERMDEGFDYMVTPLVFDLNLKLEADGYEIEKVYGSPEANEATGEIMKVNTLFPSKSEAGEVKGGLVLLKLKKISDNGSLKLKVSYFDRNGQAGGSEKSIELTDSQTARFDNTGVRKGVLLARYANLIKNWIIDERSSLAKNEPVAPRVTSEDGIILPPSEFSLGQWERQSAPLRVSNQYKEMFGQFKTHFTAEMTEINDETLQQEIKVLEKLINQ